MMAVVVGVGAGGLWLLFEQRRVSLDLCFTELQWQSDSRSRPEAGTRLRRLLKCSRAGNTGPVPRQQSREGKSCLLLESYQAA